MYSYKGVDKNYVYKVGTVDAYNEAEAIKKIKDEEEILIVTSLNRTSKVKIISNLSEIITRKLVEIENKAKSKKILEVKSTEKAKQEEKKFTNTERSPILRAINKLAGKPPKNKSGALQLDEQTRMEIQNIFRDESLKNQFETSRQSDPNYTPMNFSDQKISYQDEKPEDISKEGKKINWDLLDASNNDPEIRKNNKLKVKPKEMLMFTRRLQIMISSGVSLMNALILSQETSSENMAIVLGGVVKDIQEGSYFSEAIAKYPKIFDSSYVSLVSVGESTGELDSCLLDIIKMQEQGTKVFKKIKTASIYPSIVGVVLVIMMLAASIWFLPKFNAMYEDQGITLPVFTNIVFTIAGLIPYIVGVVIAIVIIISVSRKKIPQVNQVYIGIKDKLLLRIPIVKNVTNALYMYKFSSTVSLMLKNGIRLSDTLELAGRTIDNIYIRNEIERVGDLMVHGLSFSEAMKQQQYFDEILINIAKTGEESGQMVFSLTKVSEYYQGELSSKVDALMEAIPPASIILIAVIAAPIIVAAYLPILEISSGSGIGI